MRQFFCVLVICRKGMVDQITRQMTFDGVQKGISHRIIFRKHRGRVSLGLNSPKKRPTPFWKVFRTLFALINPPPSNKQPKIGHAGIFESNISQQPLISVVSAYTQRDQDLHYRIPGLFVLVFLVLIPYHKSSRSISS